MPANQNKNTTHNEELIQAQARIAQLERALHASISGILVCDTSYKVTFINQTWLAMHGYVLADASQVMSHSLETTLFSSEQFTKQLMPLFEHAAKQGAATGEVFGQKKDTTTFSVWVHIVQVHDQKNKTNSFTLTGRDITEQKKAEAALQQKTLELNATLNALPDLFFRLRMDGTIVHYHAGDDDDLCLPSDEFVGKKMQEVIPDPVGRKLYNTLVESLKKKQTTTLEYTLPIQEEQRFFEARFSPISTQEAAVIIRSITESKNHENTLQTRTDELERMNKLMIGRELKMKELKEKIKQYESSKPVTQAAT